MNEREAADYITHIPKYAGRNDSVHMAGLLDRLGHPEKGMRILHIAGTNGKGSVCAFLAQILQEAGFRTGLYTSPHLVSVTERFRINGVQVSGSSFAEAMTRTAQASAQMEESGEGAATYFEQMTAAGLLIFAAGKTEVLVMETGMGGRMDPTRAVGIPEVCVITSVSLDHMQSLGDTVEKIAAEKAGIIRGRCPVVYDASDRTAAEVIEKIAREAGSQAVPVYRQMARVTERSDKSIAFILNNRYYDYISAEVPSPAEYQVMNASLAMTALRIFDKDRQISDRLITEAVRHTFWPGRMEMLREDVWLDGAHNEDAMKMFAETVSRMQPERPKVLLFAASADKDIPAMIRILMQRCRFRSVVVTQYSQSRAASAQLLAQQFGMYMEEDAVYVIPDAGQAFEKALQLKGDGILLCAGSLYLAGELKKIAGMPKQQAGKRTDGISGT